MFVVMNKAIRIGLLLILGSFCAKGQTFKSLNVGLSFSIYSGNLLIAPAVNWSVGERFEVGLLPFGFLPGISSANESVQLIYGMNFTSRYFINRGNKMEPYVSLMAGFGVDHYQYTDYNSDQKITENTGLFDATLLLGNEIKLGKKGWIFDFNVGLIGVQFFDESSNFQISPIYSFGIKKKFLAK
jgi:hypothetical protein